MMFCRSRGAMDRSVYFHETDERTERKFYNVRKMAYIIGRRSWHETASPVRSFTVSDVGG